MEDLLFVDEMQLEAERLVFRENLLYTQSMTKNATIKKPEPFLKWAGGKSQLLQQFSAFFPDSFNNYIEAFTGGGAVFFHLFASGKLKNKEITLIDTNEELTNLYEVIKNKKTLNKLIKILNNGEFINDEVTFYKIRSMEPKDEVSRAARMLYLNRTCFNGLFRVNSRGKFNTPFGRYNNPQICNEENLESVHDALKNVEIFNKDFTAVLDVAKKGDFVYFDPPYHPVSKTASFTSYTKNSFTLKDQARLAKTYKELDRRGCKLMLSNSDVKAIKELYKGFRIELVQAKRRINCRASGRGVINELVILNY